MHIDDKNRSFVSQSDIVRAFKRHSEVSKKLKLDEIIDEDYCKKYQFKDFRRHMEKHSTIQMTK